MNGNTWEKDVELFRKANVNYIRTSHYPPDEALLDACDKLGMFVEEEAPFCWGHEAKIPADMHHEILVNQHLEMVNRDRSHPSVLIWSVGNESNLYKEYFKEAADAIKVLDPTRPRNFSQWGPDADNNELEIGNHHYPGPGGPDKYRRSKRPMVFDEFNHLNAYNRLELAADPGLRSLWGALLDRMWNAMYYSKGVLGGAIWAGIDDTFFLPNGHCVGYGTWGPIDGWRREKPEFWGTKKAFSPVKIKQLDNVNALGEVHFEVENRHNFTNLSLCKIQWSVGNETGTVSPDVAPRSKGTFTLQLPRKLSKKNDLLLTVINSEGITIDAYRFQLSPQIVELDQAHKGRLKVVKKADEIVVKTSSARYNISRTNGLIQGSPTLMLLPLNSEGRGIQMLGEGQNFDPYTPTCANWIAEEIVLTSTDEHKATVRVKGKYNEAQGTFVYSFFPTGKLQIAYDFEVLQPVNPRQVGLVFSLPKNFTKLDWTRKGYWSVYPDDQIDALKGTAYLFNKELPISGLAGPSELPKVPWALDQTASGSNNFRSTKVGIVEATISSEEGDAACKIFSDGTQHLRCWKDKAGIRVLVADYTNAGCGQFLTSHSSKGYRPLKVGDHIKGCVTLQLPQK